MSPKRPHGSPLGFTKGNFRLAEGLVPVSRSQLPMKYGKAWRFALVTQLKMHLRSWWGKAFW